MTTEQPTIIGNGANPAVTMDERGKLKAKAPAEPDPQNARRLAISEPEPELVSDLETYDDHVRAWQRLERVESGIQWARGDIAASLETKHGEATLERFAAQVGVEYATMRAYKAVALAYPQPVRRLTTSWSVHQVLAAQSDRLSLLPHVRTVKQARDVLVIRQEDEREEARELRRERKQARERQPSTPALPAAPAGTTEVIPEAEAPEPPAPGEEPFSAAGPVSGYSYEHRYYDGIGAVKRAAKTLHALLTVPQAEKHRQRDHLRKQVTSGEFAGAAFLVREGLRYIESGGRELGADMDPGALLAEVTRLQGELASARERIAALEAECIAASLPEQPASEQPAAELPEGTFKDPFYGVQLPKREDVFGA
jgi:hypothetical protein